jgi:hypothetical protein
VRVAVEPRCVLQVHEHSFAAGGQIRMKETGRMCIMLGCTTFGHEDDSIGAVTTLHYLQGGKTLPSESPLSLKLEVSSSDSSGGGCANCNHLTILLTRMRQIERCIIKMINCGIMHTHGSSVPRLVLVQFITPSHCPFRIFGGKVLARLGLDVRQRYWQ